MKIRFVVPCYNEEKRLPETIAQMTGYLKLITEVEYDILIIDDGSSDNTMKVAEKLSAQYEHVHYISYKPNKGKGHAVKMGMLTNHGDYDWLVFSDADGSSHLKYIMRPLLAPAHTRESILESDIIITNRELDDSKISDASPMRFLSSRIFFLIEWILLGNKINDTQNGLKAYKGNIAKKIFEKQQIDGFAFDMEILHIAKINKLFIQEVPVTWINTADSRVRLFKHSWMMFKELIKIRQYAKKGYYNID